MGALPRIITFLPGHGKGGMGRGEERHSPWARKCLEEGCTASHPLVASQSQHRDALLPLNPGGWAPAHPVPLQEQSAGFPGKGSGTAEPKTPNHTAATEQSTHLRNALWDALWKPRAQPWTWGSCSDTSGARWTPQKLRTRMGEHTNPSWLHGENHSRTGGTWGFTRLCQVPCTHKCQMNISGFSLTCNW